MGFGRMRKQVSGAPTVVRLTAVGVRFSSGAGEVLFFDFLLAMFTVQAISASALVTSNTAYGCGASADA